MKYFLFILLMSFTCLNVEGQSNDILEIDTCIFKAIERGNPEFYMVTITTNINNKPIRFFISDTLSISDDFLKIKEDDILFYNMKLKNMSKEELGILFGFRGSEFIVFDEKDKVVIDSHLDYYLFVSIDD